MATLHPSRAQARGPFRPASQYPADPYSQSSSPTTSERSSRPHRRAPWTLDLDTLDTLAQDSSRSAIIILGDPSPLALKPLLSIKSIATSLLIVATTSPSLDLPQNESTPEIRLLRLERESKQEGAARLADIMKWAEKTARQWRKEISDAEQPFTLASRPTAARTRLSFMPGNSQLLTPPTTPRMRPVSRLPKSRDRQSYHNAQRALDMIINFLPNANAKTIIKEAILVTTIAKPSLFPLSPRQMRLHSSGATEPSMSRMPSTVDLRLSSRLSRMFAGSRTSLVLSNSHPRSQSPASLTPPAPLFPARIIHILPFAYHPPPQGPFAHAHLIRKLEAFLLDFSYSPNLMKLNSHPDSPGSAERLRPFLLDRTGLAETMRIRRQEYTLGDLVMGGLLDGRDGDSRPSTGDGTSEQSDIEWSTGRAWLGGVSDISLQTPSPPSAFSGYPPPPAITVSAPHTTSLFRGPAEGSPVSATPPRPNRSDMRNRRSVSLHGNDQPPKIAVPPSAMTMNSSTRNKGALPSPPDSSESDTQATYAEYWRQQDLGSNGTTVSLNDWEGSPGWTNKPMPPTPGSTERCRPKLLSKNKAGSGDQTEASTTKKKWWSWGRSRKISAPC
ncbi:hypothetical protein FS749_003120 [Ceratobasidium sp. UAMH 11750]|nr:hypothetical protein FS749_003120 [Ceratobasidium sp. UAMH 11750]